MHVKVNGLAWLPKSELSESVLEKLRRTLTVIPSKAGDYPGEPPKPIFLFEETPTHIGIARGYFEQNRRALHEIEWAVTEGRSDLSAPHVSFGKELRAEQKQALSEVVGQLRAGRLGGIIRAVPGWGKSPRVGTPVIMYDGTVRKVEEVRVGDLLMGPDSTPRTVLSTRIGRGPLVRITPKKGDPWECNDEHILTLVHSRTNEVVDIEISDYLDLPKSGRGLSKHYLKQFAPENGVDFPKPTEVLPVDPYFLGLWYGDGRKSLAAVEISKPDPEVFLTGTQMAATWSLRCEPTTKNGKHQGFRLSGDGGNNPLLTVMRDFVGDASTIPSRILQGTREERLQFFAGFLDADGYNHAGCFEVCQKRETYLEGLCFVARSLGFKAVYGKDKWVKGSRYKRVKFSGDFSAVPLRIERKKQGPRVQKKVATRTGFTIESVGEGEYCGILLDGDGRYLLGDFTVTHNTVAACALMAEMNVPTLVVVHKEFLVTQWEERILEFLPGTAIGRVQQDVCDYRGKQVAIGMVHSLAGKRYPDEFYEWPGLIIVDECHRIGAYTWAPVPQKFAAKWRIGFSATPKRKDGADDVLHYHLGPLLFSAKEKRLLPKVKRVWTNFKLIKTPSFNPNLQNKSVVLKFLCGSATRNRVIVEQLVKALHANRKVIVLSERLLHLEQLRVLLSEAWMPDWGPVPSVGFYVGGRSQSQLDEAKEARVILATSQYAQEGLDIPALDTLILTTPLSDVEQAVGRILRPHPDKKEPVVVDIRDPHVSVCERAAKARDRYYTRLGV